MKTKRLARILLLLALAVPPASSFAEERAEDSLRARALNGDVQAQFDLANEYFYGTATRRKNPMLAAHWYRVAAQADAPAAIFNYALCLDQGIGVERDPVAAAEHYRRASEMGFMPARFNYAMVLLRGIRFRDAKERNKHKPEEILPKQDSKRAILMIKELAEKKFPPAMTEYASILIRNPDISAAQAATAFQMASEAAQSPEATAKAWRVLGDCYFSGVGVEPDAQKMLAALQKAIDMGDLDAMGRLAYCYEFGVNVPQDQKKSLELYEKAAQAGLPIAQLKYGDAIAEGRVPGKGFDDAMKLYLESARGNCPEAIHRLGMLAKDGVGMEKNPKLAADSFYAAARHGHAASQFRLAEYFLMDDGPFPKDEAAAFYWFESAAKQGYAPAQRMTAICLGKGIGCERNGLKASQWLQAAAENGDMEAIQMIDALRRMGR